MAEGDGEGRTATWPEAVIKLIEVLWQVVDQGYALQGALLLALVVPIVALWRMEPSDIGPTLQAFATVFGTRLALAAILLGLEGGTLVAWGIDRRRLLAEIKRLGDEKSYWVHNTQTIKEHRSSHFEYEQELKDSQPEGKT